MRNYGEMRLDTANNQWIITADRHIMARLKRVFEGLAKFPRKEVKISNTPEHCLDLEWFMTRYPLEIVEGADQLRVGSLAYKSMVERLDDMADPNYEPKSHPLAIPLRGYQNVAVDMYLERGSLLLGDDVGVGKTAVGIGSFTDKRTLPALVVTHVHLLHQWEREINTFMPELNTHVIKQGPIYALPEMFGKGPDVVITNYHKIAKWATVLSSYLKSIVWDEVQELRNDGSQKYQAARSLVEYANFVLGLSATPVYNYGGEFFNIMETITPGALGERYEFRREWCSGRYENKISIVDPPAFGAYLRESHLMLRRTRKDVGRELESLSNVTHIIDSDSREIIDEEGTIDSLAKILVNSESTSQEKFQAGGLFDQKMRKATGLAKAGYVAHFVNMLVESGEKVVLFGWHREVYEKWLHMFSPIQCNPVMYTGTESPAKKEAAREAFINGDSKVLIMSLRSGAGLDGLQYSGCRTVVYGEMDWSPGIHEQCTGRVYRDGQEEPVVAYYLVCEDGCDPFMVNVLGIKKQQSDGIKDPEKQFGKKESIQKNMADVARHYLERKKN